MSPPVASVYGTSRWKDERLPPKCVVWVNEVDQIMWRDWCLTSWIAGWDRDQLLRYWGYGESAEEFVDWYAVKYALIQFD